MDATDIKYDKVREWILGRRNSVNGETGKQYTWEEIFLAGRDSIDELQFFLKGRVKDDSWPLLSVDDWNLLVQSQKDSEEDTIKIAKENGAAMIFQEGQDNGLLIPQDKRSSWQCYKNGLIEGGFKKDTVAEIERATLRVLKRLNEDTTKTGAVKGMVVGNVQSGKTANMAALMAMAADWGWNMFIVLSGTIENLRLQTLERLKNDLQKRDCNLNWIPVDRLSLKKKEMVIEPSKLWIESTDNARYFTVCLKNSKRLKSMVQYLHFDSNVQKKLKILVIEDEADQGSINTAKPNAERKQINRLLCNLVNGKTFDGKNSTIPYHSMNYIGYTATPYANILNESSTESLYPKDFISTLTVSKEYFGPQQIFGIGGGDYDGLDIIRKVSQSDIDVVSDIHSGLTHDIPESLKDAICWFLCGVGAMRYWGYKKPISMLVHTSQKTDHHALVAYAIESWICDNTPNYLLDRCKKVWEKEIKEFSLDKFKEQYPDYGRGFAEVHDYPKFSELKNFIEDLLSGDKVSRIQIDDSDETLQYFKNIHLCIDNSKNNQSAKNEHVRLVYPTKEELGKLEVAPAFIVVGGATLSRGLTIEGLISTYFLRAVKQADTLMQMGRWFGYRKGYELIPRLWLSDVTEEQFHFLSTLDQELRDDIHQMAARGLSPAHYGPKVNNSPKLSFLRIVANNKMQSAKPADMDYSGSSTQTYLFDKDKNVLEENLDNTRVFLDGLGQPEDRKAVNKHAANSYVWRNVDFSVIKAYLEKYHFQTRQGVFNDVKTLIEWIEEITKKGSLQPWNVVLVGAANDGKHQSEWHFSNDLRICKVIRSQKILDGSGKDAGIINIGALRSPKDVISDIDLTTAPVSLRQKLAHFESKYAMELRDEAGLLGVPQLLVYIVDKDSAAKPNSQSRRNLDAPVDIAGLCINIPGDSVGRNCVAKLHIPMPPAADLVYNDNGDLNGTAED